MLQNQVDKLFEGIDKLDPNTEKFHQIAHRQLGTLGGGNHFIEFCLDKHDRVWIMLHSGSRKIGNTIAETHTRYAMKLPHNKGLPDKQLSVVLEGTPEYDAYKRDLYWAQEYARLNRQVMLVQYLGVLQKFFPEEKLKIKEDIWCHHNYVAEEVYNGQKVYVTRKGAIRAGKGEMGIIPGSMGSQSFLIRGLGSEESFNSASHGAGRAMPRGKAKKAFHAGQTRSIEEQLKGLDPRWEIECIRNATIADELPDCYKGVDQVMANQTDLVEVYQELHQLMVVKGGEEEPGEKKAAKHEKEAKDDSEFRKNRKLAREMKGAGFVEIIDPTEDK
jgi:tRNA-splicing ligase RtcB